MTSREAIQKARELADRIEVISTQSRVRGVAERWREQYGHAPQNPHWAEILRQLDALDKETASAADVEAIIGNRSWTRVTCNVCEEEVTACVRLGDEPDYDSATVFACGSCLRAALAVFTEAIEGAGG